MATIEIQLYEDWLETVRQVFNGSGQPLPADLEAHQIALAYFLQTAADEKDAREQALTNEQRLLQLQQSIVEHFDQVIEPDIKLRTGYQGDLFKFEWVFQNGEHIVERYSAYRIPLS